MIDTSMPTSSTSAAAPIVPKVPSYLTANSTFLLHLENLSVAVYLMCV